MTAATTRAAPVAAGPQTALALRSDVRLHADGDTVHLAVPAGTLTLRPVPPVLRTVLDRLAAGPVSRAELDAAVPPGGHGLVDQLLGRIAHLTALVLRDGDRELLRLEPTARDAGHEPAPVAADVPVRLSRFAFCRSRDDVMVLESPLAKYRVPLGDPVLRELVTAVGGPRTAHELTGGGWDLAAVRAVLAALAGAGFLEPAGGAEDPVLRQWDFHDLLFHSRVRSGRYDDPFGALYPYLGEIPPRPAVKPPPAGRRVPLHRPELSELLARDPALTTALETRRSIRDYGDAPLTVAQLGEFLYRVGRVRAHYGPPDDPHGEVVSRPYPSGGGAYDLELYLTVRRCDGLAGGIYYYDPVAHGLVLVNDDPVDRQSMLNVAGRATGMTARPDVLITMTSRFQRMSWKYRAIAYATVLRHTGVLYQTMYLVATAMGLAPCGLGNGDADMSTRVLHLDYLTESSVGDFILGSRGPQEPFTGEPAPGWRLLNSPEWSFTD